MLRLGRNRLARAPLRDQLLFVAIICWAIAIKSPHPGLPHLREQIVLLLLDVVLDCSFSTFALASKVSSSTSRPQIRQNALDAEVLLERLEQDVLGPLRLHGGIEIALLDVGVNRQLVGDLGEELLFAAPLAFSSFSKRSSISRC